MLEYPEVSSREGVDRRIARIARRQHGVFSWEQAMRAGATPNTAQQRLKTGRWERLRNGVYGSAAIVVVTSRHLDDVDELAARLALLLPTARSGSSPGYSPVYTLRGS